MTVSVDVEQPVGYRLAKEIALRRYTFHRNVFLVLTDIIRYDRLKFS